MKGILVILSALAVFIIGLNVVQGHAAEQEPARKHRVVWQVTARTPEPWHSMRLNVENCRDSVGAANSEVIVIAHAARIGIVRTSNAAQAERIKKLMTDGVKFMACENSLERKKSPKKETMPGIGFVDSGVAEVVRLQADGWACINAGE